MKSMITTYTLFIILLLSSAVFSYSNHKIHLYDIIRKTVNKDSDTILLEVRPHKFVLQTKRSSPVKEQTQSTEPPKENKKQQRDTWDSGEEQYFKWASLNRRPMESLAGRK